MKRKILIFAAVVVAVILVLVLVVPMLINVDTFRPTIQAKASEALGRQVTIGHLSLALLSGGVTADDITVADDPAFSKAPFLKARSLQVGVDLPALLFSHALNVRSFTVVQPSVVLLRNNSGKWNFSSLGNSKSENAGSPAGSGKAGGGATGSGSSGGGAPADVSVQKLSIQKASLEVGLSGGKKETYSNVNVDASNLSYNTAFPFTVTADTPGGGSLKLDGKAGPVDRADTSNTPFDATLTTKGVNLASTGFIPPDSGIAGVVDYNGHVHSDGKTLHAEGTGTARDLKLVKTGSPSKQPVTLEYASDYNLQQQTGVLSRGALKTGNSQLQATGNFDARGKDLALNNVKVTGDKLAMGDISGLLPALGVALPMGSSLQGGTVSANLVANGPLDKLVSTGNLDVSNVKLTGFSMVQKLSSIAALAGLHGGGAETMIQTLSSALRMGPEGLRADNLNLVVPELGTVTGAGTVASNNALDFKLLIKPAANIASAAGASLTSGLAKLTGGSGGTAGAIPVLVQGTTEKPVFVPDVSGLVKNQLGAQAKGLLGGKSNAGAQGTQNPAQGVGDVLNGIFGKKKKPQ